MDKYMNIGEIRRKGKCKGGKVIDKGENNWRKREVESMSQWKGWWIREFRANAYVSW